LDVSDKGVESAVNRKTTKSTSFLMPLFTFFLGSQMLQNAYTMIW